MTKDTKKIGKRSQVTFFQTSNFKAAGLPRQNDGFYGFVFAQIARIVFTF